MPALYRGVCYPTTAQAKAEHCSQTLAAWGSGSTAYTLECVPDADPSAPTYGACVRVNGSACTTSSVAYPSFPECDYEGGASVAYDWGLSALALLVVIYGGKQLIRLFEVHHEKD